MIGFIRVLFLIIGVMAIWIGINIAATTQGWFSHPIATKGDSVAFMSEAVKSIKNNSNGNATVVLMKNGQIFDKFSTSQGTPVSSDTVFGVSSLGKWVAAVGVMTLVDQGQLNLDTPVSNYLTRWQLPVSEFNNDDVTIRRLLSHTAGIIDGLGHNGFATQEQVQSLEDHLTKALDADEGISGKVMVSVPPGSQFKYSGGSYNLLQLIVEEVSGMSFEDYMAKAVFIPLGMTNTTYHHDGVQSLAQYFDDKGEIRQYPYYTSLAATGLYSSAEDLIKFLSLNVAPNLTEQPKIVAPELLELMRTPHASTMGINVWGLGVMLFADNNEGGFIIGHGGQSPSLNSTARINPATGNGIIMLTTGNRALASDTATQWTLWETGNPDMYMLKNMIPDMLKRTAIGCAVILLMSLIIVWLRKRRRSIA
jgi:CubicO group peptidase (beta-lactamase class C family)